MQLSRNVFPCAVTQFICSSWSRLSLLLHDSCRKTYLQTYFYIHFFVKRAAAYTAWDLLYFHQKTEMDMASVYDGDVLVRSNRGCLRAQFHLHHPDWTASRTCEGPSGQVSVTSGTAPMRGLLWQTPSPNMFNIKRLLQVHKLIIILVVTPEAHCITDYYPSYM